MQNSACSQNLPFFRRLALIPLPGIVLFLAFAAFFGAGLASPCIALAASYEMSRVSIDASITPECDLRVVESRNISGGTAGSWTSWSLAGFPDDSEVSISKVAIESESNGDSHVLSEHTLAADWREGDIPQEPCYAIDSKEKALHVFFGDLSGDLLVTLEYCVDDAVSVYQDVAQLQWKYVDSTWECDCDNVKLSLRLPVPDGVSVEVGETVYAWGHGPANGSLVVGHNGTVTYENAHINQGQYAQARVLFPTEWLTELDASSEQFHEGTYYLDIAISQESEWADQTNNSKLIDLAMLAIAVVVGILLLIAALVVSRKWGVFSRSRAKGEPVSCNSAVWYRLRRLGMADWSDFGVSLCQCVVLGIVEATPGSYEMEGALSRRADDMKLILLCVPDDPLLARTVQMVFGEEAAPGVSVWLNAVVAKAVDYPSAWMSDARKWRDTQDKMLNAGGFFDASCEKARKALNIGAAVYLVVGIVYGIAISNPVAAAVPVLVSFAVVLLAHPMRGLTQAGELAYKQMPEGEEELERYMATKNGQALVRACDAAFMAACARES